MTRISPDRWHPPVPTEPMQPESTPKRKAPMRRVSKRMQQIKRETNPEREAFVDAAGVCMVEGCPNEPMGTTHEVTCGNGREDALYRPRMQMAVCPKHHEEFHNNPKWTKKRQLAQRVRWELKQFAAEFCDGVGAAPSYFTVDELIDYLMFMKPVKKQVKRGKS